MDHVVVDSGVAIKWFIVELHSAEAIRVLDRYQAGTLELLAPGLIFAEFGNVLWKKQAFQGLSAADAQSALDEFRALTLAITSDADLLADAYRLAVTHRRTVYDALYLALSVRERCPFVTADEKLANALGPTFSNVIWVANWP